MAESIGGGLGGGIGGALGGIIALATDKGIPSEYEQIVDLWFDLQSPTFDMRDLNPAQLNIVSQVSPQAYSAIVSQPVSLAADSREGRDAQVGTLGYLERVQREGLPLGERLAAKQQQEALASERSRGDEAIMENLASRGRLGGGSEIAARAALGQHATNLASAQGDQLAMAAIQNRMGASLARGQLGSSLRGQDQANAQFNANAMNRFNEWVSGLQTGAAQYGAQERGRAQTANAGNRQRVADFNELSAYENRAGNLDRRNTLTQQSFGNDIARLGGLSNALGTLGGAKDAHEAARQQNIRGIGQGVGQAAGGAFGGFI